MNKIQSSVRSKEEQSIIVSQWQTCVEMANEISQRRDTMNNIFVTLNLAIFATVSFVWNIKSIIVLFAGVGVCVIWLLFINNYKILNKSKYNVINRLEKMLPTMPFKEEWDELREKKKYIDGTKLERILPCGFIILYLFAIGVVIANKIF